MSTTVVNHRDPRHGHGPDYVYVGRPSIWGNPFSHLEGTRAKFKVPTREEAIERYREYLLASPELMAQLHTLKGKTLGCWCAPQPCHGDVLAELADQLPDNPKTN